MRTSMQQVKKLHGYVDKDQCRDSAACPAHRHYALATGAVPPDFGAAGVEVFYDRKRLIGSCTETDLPAELTDATERSRLLPGWIAVLKTIRDGCGAQCAFVLRN